MRHWIAVGLFLCAFSAGGGAADELTALTVATRALLPFAYRSADSGQWQGIAIELWHRVASDLGYQSRYVEVSFNEMLQAVTGGRYDAAVGALSVTPERETAFDFTHPFYRTRLGIAVVRDDTGSWWSIVRGFTSPRFLGVLTALLALLAIVGAVVCLLERRHNKRFPEESGSRNWCRTMVVQRDHDDGDSMTC